MADGEARGTGPETARSKSRIGAANVDRILDAALTAFAQHGLRGTRIEQIAEAAGMSKTNLLYYFRTKDELYKAVLTRTLELWLEPLRALNAEAGPEVSLRGYIAQKLEASRSQPEASRLFAIEIMQGAPHLAGVLETELAALVSRKTCIIQNWIAEGKMAPIEPRHLIFMIWATTQHYADFATQIRALTGTGLEDDAFFEEAREAVMTTILNGVLTR